MIRQNMFKRKNIFFILGILLLTFLLSVFNKNFLSFETGNIFIINISIFIVLIGGFLAFLSPCAGFIIPASSFFILSKNKFKTFLYFYLGFITIFIPLTFAGSIIALLFIPYTEYFFKIAAILLFVIAITDFFRMKCSTNLLYTTDVSFKTSFFMGISYSFTSIACSGPILGIIISLSYASGFYLIYPFILSLLFAFGMLLPVIILGYIPISKKIYTKLNKKVINIKIFSYIKKLTYLQFLKILSLIISGFILLFYKKIDSSFYIKITSYLYNNLSEVTELVWILILLFIMIIIIITKNYNSKKNL